MAYLEINGTQVTTQPSEFKWEDREVLGVDGNGHPIYSSIRSVNLKWELISMADFGVLNNYYRNQGTTGTVVVALPRWSGASYAFYGYTGCVLEEPSVGAFFLDHLKDVNIKVTGIRD